MKIYSYIGKQPWAVAIEVGTMKAEAHTELCFDRLDIPEPFFSSTLDTGPRFATFEQLTSQDPADWLITDLGVSIEDEDLVYKASQMILQQAAIYGSAPTYNEEGIARNFLPEPLIKQNPKEYFCSQVVVTACQCIGLFQNMVAALMSPGNVKDWLDAYLLKWQELRFRVNED